MACQFGLLLESGLEISEQRIRDVKLRNGKRNLGSLYASKIPELRHRWDAAQECYERAQELGLKVAEPYPPTSQ